MTEPLFAPGDRVSLGDDGEFLVIIAALDRRWANGERAPDSLYVQNESGVAFWIIAAEATVVERDGKRR